MYAIHDFISIPLPHESSQYDAFNWIIEAHTEAERCKNKLNKDELEKFKEELTVKLNHVGCKPGIIQKRGYFLKDFLHHNWEEMDVYRLDLAPEGCPMEKRQKLHKQFAMETMAKFYPGHTPAKMVYVTCTGYTSPSPAQEIVALRGGSTDITPVYHTGCYGAIPAIKVASGLDGADVVHTELCTLHLNPALHGASQLVFQSLFADGCIKYSVSKKTDAPHLKILKIHEEIIPNTLNAMSWDLSQWGFTFQLSKEVPVYIMRNAEGFMHRLYGAIPFHKEKIIYAIHPGGPKIIDYIQQIFGCTNEQIKHSRQILQNHGNMSSATVPHIWKAVLEDASVPNGTQIVSLAFGPGLTIAGSILEKSCGI